MSVFADSLKIKTELNNLKKQDKVLSNKIETLIFDGKLNEEFQKDKEGILNWRDPEGRNIILFVYEKLAEWEHYRHDSNFKNKISSILNDLPIEFFRPELLLNNETEVSAFEFAIDGGKFFPFNKLNVKDWSKYGHFKKLKNFLIDINVNHVNNSNILEIEDFFEKVSLKRKELVKKRKLKKGEKIEI